MAAMSIRMDVQGTKELLAKLNAVKRSIARRILRKAVRKGAAVVTKTTRRFVPTDNKVLKKSIGHRVARMKNKPVAVAVSGPRRRFKKGGQIATKYAHLVEGGAKAHVIPRGSFIPLAASGVLVMGRIHRQNIQHPGAPAQRFMERGYNAAKSQALQTVAQVVSVELAREAAKAHPNEVDDGN
jgi:HK97 gp10 family phage protein